MREFSDTTWRAFDEEIIKISMLKLTPTTLSVAKRVDPSLGGKRLKLTHQSLHPRPAPAPIRRFAPPRSASEEAKPTSKSWLRDLVLEATR